MIELKVAGKSWTLLVICLNFFPSYRKYIDGHMFRKYFYEDFSFVDYHQTSRLLTLRCLFLNMSNLIFLPASLLYYAWKSNTKYKVKEVNKACHKKYKNLWRKPQIHISNESWMHCRSNRNSNSNVNGTKTLFYKRRLSK